MYTTYMQKKIAYFNEMMQYNASLIIVQMASNHNCIHQKYWTHNTKCNGKGSCLLYVLCVCVNLWQTSHTSIDHKHYSLAIITLLITTNNTTDHQSTLCLLWEKAWSPIMTVLITNKNSAGHQCLVITNEGWILC